MSKDASKNGESLKFRHSQFLNKWKTKMQLPFKEPHIFLLGFNFAMLSMYWPYTLNLKQVPGLKPFFDF